MTSQQIIVRISHVRAAKLCTKGARNWFETYGFSWSDFLANGKAVEELEATNDPLAFRVTAIARSGVRDGQ